LARQFDLLARKCDSRATETGRQILLKQWDAWQSDIQAELLDRTRAATEPPATGVLGRLAGGLFGFLIPTAILEAIAGTAFATFIYALAVIGFVVVPITTRTDAREKHLRKLQADETQLRGRLEPATPPAGEPAART
jgi:predicted lipid-binding transport protein (Tim44 family)